MFLKVFHHPTSLLLGVHVCEVQAGHGGANLVYYAFQAGGVGRLKRRIKDASRPYLPSRFLEAAGQGQGQFGLAYSGAAGQNRHRAGTEDTLNPAKFGLASHESVLTGGGELAFILGIRRVLNNRRGQGIRRLGFYPGRGILPRLEHSRSNPVPEHLRAG